MFETASNWEVINNYTEVTYPSGRMRVRNSTSGSRTIGVKKDFITGTGEHTVSFDVTLPIFSCIGGIVMGASSTDSLGSGFNASDTIAGVENYQTLSYPSDFYAVVEIRDENNSIVLKDSTNITATHSYTFSAPQGKEYNISLYSNRFCPSSSFHIDNVFISYDTLEVITGNTIIVSDTLFIINNDFENPVIEPNGAGVKIDGWTHYSPSTTLSVEPHNGSDWLKVVSTVGSHGAHQGFSVEPGETYTFEIDLHRPAGMNNEINIVIWKNTGPSGALSIHVLNTDGFNTFNYTATSSNIYIQIRQAGTYYLDNIRMYRTYQDTVFVGGFDVDMAYRYGFNGMERDDDIKGRGNSYTTEFRQYDPRLGRWLSIDPLFKNFPWQSPYVAFDNNPIVNNDPKGAAAENQSDGSKSKKEKLQEKETKLREKAFSIRLPIEKPILYKINSWRKNRLQNKIDKIGKKIRDMRDDSRKQGGIGKSAHINIGGHNGTAGTGAGRDDNTPPVNVPRPIRTQLSNTDHSIGPGQVVPASGGNTRHYKDWADYSRANPDAIINVWGGGNTPAQSRANATQIQNDLINAGVNPANINIVPLSDPPPSVGGIPSGPSLW